MQSARGGLKNGGYGAAADVALRGVQAQQTPERTKRVAGMLRWGRAESRPHGRTAPSVSALCLLFPCLAPALPPEVGHAIPSTPRARETSMDAFVDWILAHPGQHDTLRFDLAFQWY